MPRLLWEGTVYNYVKYVKREKNKLGRELRRASKRKRRRTGYTRRVREGWDKKTGPLRKEEEKEREEEN